MFKPIDTVMLVHVETTSGSIFSIRMNIWDTVLDIKKKIEKSHGFTVSSQELYFKGMPLLNDDSYLILCKIVNNSRLLLVLPDGYNLKDSRVKNQGWPGMVTYDQMLRQAMPSLLPSNATEGFVNQRWPAIARSNNDQMLHQTVQSPVPQAFFNQGWPTMARSNNDQMLRQAMQSPVPQAFFNQGLPAMARSNNDQMLLQQTEQSPLDSCSIDELLQLVSDMPVTAEDISKMQSWTAEGNVNIQESSGRNDNNQDLLQRESSHPSNTFGVGDFSFGEDRPLSTEHFTNSQNYLPASTAEEIFNMNQLFQTEQATVPSNTSGNLSFGGERALSIEDYTNIQSYTTASTTEAIINENQVLQTGQTSVPSHSTEERINTQDLPARVGSSDQVVQREKSPPIREVLNIPDSPVKVKGLKIQLQKLRITVLPYSRDNKPVSTFRVIVTASEKVEELKKELEKIQQRSPLDLPEEGYLFIHKQRVLDEDQSFRWNGVDNGDTIRIFPGSVSKEGSRTERLERTFGI